MSKIAYADFETITANTSYFKEHQDTRVWLWCVMSGLTYQIGIDIDSFLKYIQQYEIVYFHNLSFDGDFIAKRLEQLKFKYDVFGLCEIPNSFYVFRNGARIYYLKANFNGHIITFKCSLLMLNSSIKSLGKDLGLQKLFDGQKDFYDVEPFKSLDEVPKKYLDYIYNDVLIAQTAMNKLNELVEHKKWLSKGSVFDYLTITALYQSLTLNNKIIKDAGKYMWISKRNYDIGRKLLRGGLCQFNPIYQGEHTVDNVVMIDINSAYPSFMNGVLPFGEGVDLDSNNKIKVYHLLVKEVEILRKHNNIICFPNMTNQYDEEEFNNVFNVKRSYKVKRRYISKEETPFEIYLYENELATLKKFYIIKYDIINVYYYQAHNFLTKLESELYKDKAQFKKEGKSALCAMTKIFLNAGYGSFCKKESYDSYMYLENPKDVLYGEKARYEYKNNHPTYNIGNLNCYGYNEILNEPTTKFRNIHIAAFTTACTRSYLLNTLLKVCKEPNKSFVYCDTDSILLCNLSKEELDKIKAMDTKDLGGWGIEFIKESKTKIRILGAKRYEVEGIKCKVGGISSLKSLADIEDGTIVNDCGLTPKRVRSGIVLVSVDKQVKRGVN